VSIPKRVLHPNDSRFLSISGPRDKVIQKAIQQVLENLFEPIMRNRSHGFRPGRSCHTALKAVGMAG
jgi:retron-type reverse transcriptase